MSDAPACRKQAREIAKLRRKLEYLEYLEYLEREDKLHRAFLVSILSEALYGRAAPAKRFVTGGSWDAPVEA